MVGRRKERRKLFFPLQMLVHYAAPPPHAEPTEAVCEARDAATPV